MSIKFIISVAHCRLDFTIPFQCWIPSNRDFARFRPGKDCHQWLSDSYRVHQIHFRPGLRLWPRWVRSQCFLRPSSRLLCFHALLCCYDEVLRSPLEKSGNWSGEWSPCKHPLCRTPLKFPIGLRHGKTTTATSPSKIFFFIYLALLTQYLRLWQTDRHTYIHTPDDGTDPRYACVARVKTPFHETHFYWWQYASTAYWTI